MDNNSDSNLGGAPAEKPTEGADGPAKEEKKEENNDWLELIDPQSKVIVLGITFEKSPEEDAEAFRKRWKSYLGNVYAAVDPGEDVPMGKRNNAIAMGLQMTKIENALFGEPRVPQSKKEKEQALQPHHALAPSQKKAVIFRWDNGVFTREEVSGEDREGRSGLEGEIGSRGSLAAAQQTTQTVVRDPEIEQRVVELSSQVETLSRSLQDQRSAVQLPEGSGAPDYVSVLEKLKFLEEQLQRIAAGTSQASTAAYAPTSQTPVSQSNVTAIDYKSLGDAIGESMGGKIGTALKQTLETIASLFAKIAATPRAPAQPATYIAQPLPSPQYEAPPSTPRDATESPTPGPQSGGSAAHAPNYWAMDYKEVRRAAGASLDAAEKMLLESAINNCSNPHGEQALERLVTRRPAQAEAFRAYVQRHRERIGIAKPKAPK